MQDEPLEWGETPFHRMDPEQLLRESIRMYNACESALAALQMLRADQEGSPFWISGSGAKALEKTWQVVNPLEDRFGVQGIHRSFYRHGIDLLWKDRGPVQLAVRWAVCPVCTQMISAGPGRHQGHWGKRCGDVMPGDGSCDGILRPISWDDLKHPK